jgi:hypothetical protein
MIANLPDTRNLITGAVGAARIRHGMTMVTICIKLQHLQYQYLLMNKNSAT